MKKTTDLILDLYWEYDRMSSSGQDTLDQLAKKFKVPTHQEMLKIMEEENDS